MYSKLPNLTLGFHGCDIETYKKVLYYHKSLKPSKNLYDWLGNGIYFWENSYERAKQWAEDYCNRYNKRNPNSTPKIPAVIGAVISLGYCLNLSDYKSNVILQLGYDLLKINCEATDMAMPINKNINNNNDLLIRNLDCAVIQQIHDYNKNMGLKSYDSVRGVFVEGSPVYENSGIMNKTHIQICVTNPNCIKGYFRPLEHNKEYDRV